MQRAAILTTIVALALAGVVLAAAWVFFRPAGPPLVEAAFAHTELSPNADGTGDVTHITYRLRRAAAVARFLAPV